MADNNFETNMQRQMEEFKMNPSGEVWHKVEEQLQKDKSKRRWFFLWLPLMAVTIGMGWFIFNNQFEQTDMVKTKQKNVLELVTKELQAPEAEIIKIETQNKELKIYTSIEKKQSLKKRNGMLQKNDYKIGLKTKKSKTEKLFFQIKIDQVVSEVKVKGYGKEALVEKIKEVKIDTPQAIHIAPVLIHLSAIETLAAIVPSSVEKKDADTLLQTLVQVKDTTIALTKTDTAKKKWQLGLQINAGIADIRTSPILKTGFNAENASYSPLGLAVAGQPGSGILVTDYAIKKNSQFGLGILFRRKISATTFFETGVQYQFNSFKITERQRRDSIVQPSNTRVTFFKKETTTTYNTHYITVPTTLQMQLMKNNKGSLTFSAGIHHFIHLASSNSMKDNRLPGVLYNNSPSVFQSSVSTAFYQPVLHLAPAYEWNKHKNTMQLGWYMHYGITTMYTPAKYHLWQTGLSLQYWFKTK